MHKYLFLDRDGVINVENMNGYILSIDAFIFEEGVIEAMQIFSQHFERIFIVTNQRCVGRGMITHQGLEAIHQYMLDEFKKYNIHIDQIYYAPALESDDWYRKPNTGMMNTAHLEFPEIKGNESVMVGNNLSDMEFGKRSGMTTCLLNTTSPAINLPNTLVDMQFTNLLSYAKSI